MVIGRSGARARVTEPEDTQKSLLTRQRSSLVRSSQVRVGRPETA